MITRVRCAECGEIYNRDINSWTENGTTVTTIIICPNCGSDSYVKADTTWKEG